MSTEIVKTDINVLLFKFQQRAYLRLT